MNDFLNNGKVLIGSRYDENPLKPRYVERDPDMLEIQKWLINDPERLRLEYWCDMFYKVATGLVVAIVVLMYAKN